jgi:hypothetical protein
MKVEKFEVGEDPNPERRHPLVGHVYEVSDVLESPLRWRGETVLGLVGVPGLHRAIRFRPIVSRKTDISIFTRMLTDKTVDA